MCRPSRVAVLEGVLNHVCGLRLCTVHAKHMTGIGHGERRACAAARQPWPEQICDDFLGLVSNPVMAAREIAVTGPDIPISPRPPPVKEPAR